MVYVSTVDKVLPLIGEMGLSQILVMCILSLLVIPATFQYLITYFIAHNPAWKCKENSTICLLRETMKSVDHVNYTYRCNISRSEWEYVEVDPYSIVTQFGLYCDREYLILVQTSLMFIGSAVGAIVFGWCADKYGRKRMIVPCMVSALFIALFSSFSPVFWVFSLTRLVIGFIAPGTTLMFFIIASEMVGPKYRPITGITLWFFFTVSLVILGTVAIYVRTWKMLMIYSTAPYIVLLPLIYFIPESLRWLHVSGHMKEAHKLIDEIARINNKKLDEPITLSPAKVTSHKINPLLLFKGYNMTLMSLNIGFGWMVNGLVYYGISLAASDLTGARYRDYILSSLVEFPAAIIGIFASIHLGRKYSTIIPMFLGGIFCAAVAAVDQDETKGELIGLRLAFGLAGKFLMTLGYDVIYTWTVELYPTQIRTEAMGYVQITSRIGNVLSPWIAKGLRKYSTRVPFMVQGILAIIAAVFLFWLPETKSRATVEFLDESDESELVKEEELPAIVDA